jgi:hypothetical protein
MREHGGDLSAIPVEATCHARIDGVLEVDRTRGSGLVSANAPHPQPHADLLDGAHVQTAIYASNAASAEPAKHRRVREGVGGVTHRPGCRRDR